MIIMQIECVAAVEKTVLKDSNMYWSKLIAPFSLIFWWRVLNVIADDYDRAITEAIKYTK